MVRTPVHVAYVAWWGGGLALATKRETSAAAVAMGDDIHRKGRENCLPPPHLCTGPPHNPKR